MYDPVAFRAPRRGAIVFEAQPSPSGSRRPIEPVEVPHFQRLGETLRRERERVGLSIAECARRACISGPYLSRLERGHRRTRRTTIERIATAFWMADLYGTQRPVILAKLLEAAGIALAPESCFQERVEQRRGRRVRRARYVARIPAGYCPGCARPL